MELWFRRYETETLSPCPSPKQPSSLSRSRSRNPYTELSLRLSLLHRLLCQHAARFAWNGTNDFVCDNLWPQTKPKPKPNPKPKTCTTAETWTRLCVNDVAVAVALSLSISEYASLSVPQSLSASMALCNCGFLCLPQKSFAIAPASASLPADSALALSAAWFRITITPFGPKNFDVYSQIERDTTRPDSHFFQFFFCIWATLSFHVLCCAGREPFKN